MTMIPPTPAVAELLRTPIDRLIEQAREPRPRLRDKDGDEIGWTIRHPMDLERDVED